MLKPTWLCLAFVFGLFQFGEAPAAAAQLDVEGSAFVLRLADGRLLRGTELTGAVVELDLGGPEPTLLKLASIQPHPEHPDILRHDFQVPDEAGGWRPVCGAGASGARWGFPVKLPPGHPGRDRDITLTCMSGALAKCAVFGYAPWRKGPKGENLLPLHAACVHMVRADYCGDGTPYTKEGTTIDTYDDLGVQTRGLSDDDRFEFEAGWSPEGAVCVDHTRWSDLIRIEQLKAQCPRLARVPGCDEPTARALGARLFNASRRLPEASVAPGATLGASASRP